jgi:NAD(P)-dependent dehydrogenase (short-subunit alcohol dehydrogenase family)
MSVVLITGCSSGFGLLSALEFARQGHETFASMRNIAKADPLRKMAESESLAVEVVELDVMTDASVQRAVSSVVDAAGRIDIVVNNAGIGRYGTVELILEEHMRETFETNFFGPVRVMRSVLPHMRAQRSGCIVNVTSVAAVLPGIPGTSMYSASKHALSAVTEALRVELEPFGISVALVEPGFFTTSVVDNAPRELDPSSPYADLEQAVVQYFTASMSAAADPQVVARTIVGLATGPPTDDIHHPVGEDAKMLIEASKTMSELEWVGTGKTLMGLP